ncbi:acyl-CoA dehydrogenase family protein [Mycobacterium sp. CVI_P3]|uniref:Acyl-CoA dehydrogenase family protein n=1 Tax=Mycobacterium pinniadriaticum TaxID=2994102 RepID=A0ABT3SD15_9MYCO|nr:acyl-CoA dehydrogenase family protein [Mycobacterium pinniadriaticum]MCX2930609.1 acyl-CoA dehydrogenase family protein [Mycobacterium pinniadriaticum]MCX2937033.1 acyl-CoA dehydrogenase family protein [Mycobacterium pinniadriaticum]
MADARNFLDEHAEHRPDGFPDAMFAQFRYLADPEAARRDCVAWQRLLFDNGFAGLTWPHAVGGRALPSAYALAWADVESEYDVPRGLFGVTLEMVGPTLLAVGTREQKSHCTAILRGDEVWCQLFSEPGAGSDLAGVATRATRTESGWRINGQKVWTSEARHARYGYLLARSDPSQSRHRGLTAFVVDMTAPGVDVRPLKQMTGGASFSEVFFDDVALPADAVLGEVGGGWTVAMTTLGFERFSSFGRSLGRLVRQAAELGWNDTASRERFVDAIIDQRALAAFEAGVHRRLLAGQSPGPEAALAKIATGSVVSTLADAVAGRLGNALSMSGAGFDDWRLVVLSAPAFHIAGGTDEIVKTMIAERVLGLPRG